jgi:beta-xylosidase
MKAVDPTIKLVGPEVHQFNDDPHYNPKDSAGRDWMIEFLRANGDMVDVVSFHRYPFPQNVQENATIADLRQHIPEWDRTIPYLRGLIQEYTGRDLPVAITEVNTHYSRAVGTESSPDSHFNAIWLAEMFGRLMYQDVFMVNHWMLTSSGGSGGWGIIGRGEVRPSYYVYQLFKQFGTELLYTDSGVEDVSVYAARRDDGALTIMAVNAADAEKQVRLQIAGETSPSYQLWRLDQEQIPQEAMTIATNNDEPLSLPPQSISLLVADP